MAEPKQAQEPTQKTQPKTDAEPAEIPVPKREDVFRDLAKVAPPPPQESEDRKRKGSR